jgi:hypothetical protein
MRQKNKNHRNQGSIDEKIRFFSQSIRHIPVPEIIDPVFAKTSQNARFLLSENDRFGLVFVKTGSINSGTDGFALCKKRDRKILTLGHL